MGEIKKWIEGFEGLYWITNTGRIISADRYDRFNRKVGGEIKLGARSRMGYLGAALYKNGKSYQRLVHRLVAEAFIPNPENKPCIDHIDGNNKNNNVKNLRWVTYKENMNNPITRARILNDTSRYISQMGAGNPFSRKVKMYSLDGEYLKTFDCIREAAKFAGVSDGSIGRVCRGERSQSGGYFWEYDGKPKMIIKPAVQRQPTNKRPIQQLLPNGELVAEYGSIQEATDALGICAPNIIHCAKGELKTYKGYKWRYKK